MTRLKFVPKPFLLLLALLALAGSLLFSGQSGGEVQAQKPKALGNVQLATVVTVNGTCTTSDWNNYRASITGTYDINSTGKVDITSVKTYFSKKSFGIWGSNNWVSSMTEKVVNAGNTYIIVGPFNPGSTNTWDPGTPYFQPNGLKATETFSGGAISGSCTVDMP